MSGILYRVWDKEEEEFVEDYPVLIDGKGRVYGFNGYGDNVEVMGGRYDMDMKTGLLDEDMNDIFINDFVVDSVGDYYLVEVENGVAIEPFTTWITSEEVAVAGNTRQHPEILENLKWR